MQHYSIVIGCDQLYYDTWSVHLLKSIHFYNPWIKLRCHIVNPSVLIKLPYVEYTTETIVFKNDISKISYFQAVRFIAASKIPLHENFITLDADTICTQSFTKECFAELFKALYVKQHHKNNKWLASLVSFGAGDFRYDYANMLNHVPLDKWKWGRDQHILAKLDIKYKYTPVADRWLISGKPRDNCIFLTLKGNQKLTDKYLNTFNTYKVDL